MKVAILYIGISEYISFWKDFYKSSERYFLNDAKKDYFVFSNSKNFDYVEAKNVFLRNQEDLGWPGNTLYRFKMFDSIKNILENYDYVFFFNANTLFLKEVKFKDVIPTKEEGYIVSLSFKDTNIYDYKYERRRKSKAYIPYGKGKKYYQGGFFGGRKEEFINLVEECNNYIMEDDRKKIIAIFHDESYLNKYLLNNNSKNLSLDFLKPEEWGNKKEDCKGVFRTKENYLQKKNIENMKKLSLKDKIRMRFQKKVVRRFYKKREKFKNLLFSEKFTFFRKDKF